MDDPDEGVYKSVSDKIISFGKEIIPQAVGTKKILSYQYEGYWTDIGNIDSFFEANIGLTDDLPKFNLFPGSRENILREYMTVF